MKNATRWTLLLALALAGAGACAQVLRVASQGDAMSIDPHTHNEGLQLSLLGNVYEPLVARSASLALVPALATAWRQVSPTAWRFELRRGVRFHDGTPFSSEDAAFSLRRAMQVPEFRVFVGDIAEVRVAGSHAIEIETRTPSAVLPHQLTMVYMMSRAWCESVGAAQPAERVRGQENTASFRANGTGPFRLRERQPDARTVLSRHAAYWGRIEGNVQEVVFMPIANPATRVAALLSGEVDVVDPVPVQDIAAVNASGRARVLVGPELRVLFLGMDQRNDELRGSNVAGRNPLKDRRVRQAIYQAVDIAALQRVVMHGAATPTALMVAAGVTGHDAARNTRLAYDPTAARRLLAEAGYAEGFDLPMHCPNDRYVADEGICQAVAANLARVGIRAKLVAETKSSYFRKVLGRESPFYLLGWAPATYDALNVWQALVACADGKGLGHFNAGGYCNPRVDELARAAQAEPQAARRESLLREALALHDADIGHIPLHQQALAWGLRHGVRAEQRPDNMMNFAGFSVAPARGGP